MNKDALVTHKYNCAVWLQSVSNKIKEQRKIVAKCWLEAEKDGTRYKQDKARNMYKNEYDKLQHLYTSRNKIMDERQQYNNKTSSNIAI